MSAISGVFNNASSHRSAPLVVGSVKSNIGHLEATAALLGVIKAVLCMQYEQIPPQMHFENPNPRIDFSKIAIPKTVFPWPATNGIRRKAAVNCFGAGGTNGHCVLESIEAKSSRSPRIHRPYLYMISALNENAVRKMGNLYADYVEQKSPHLEDLAYTMLSRRSSFNKSYFFTATNMDEIVSALRESDPAISSKTTAVGKNVIWIFTGQGAQWPAMGVSLLKHSTVFRKAIKRCETYLSELSEPPPWSLVEELCRDGKSSRVFISQYAQPLSTALQLALVELWKSWGLRPDAVVGHSSGEAAAAYASGHLSLRDAILVAYFRGRFFGNLTSNGKRQLGGMCAAGVNETQSTALIEPFNGRVQLGAVNSPSSCTLSGDLDAIEEVMRACEESHTFCRKLRVDVAYHSNHVLPVAEEYQETLEQANVQAIVPSIACKMYSSVTGSLLQPGACTAEYWKDNMTSTVRFSDALSSCVSENQDVSAYLEVGPHPALRGPSHDVLGEVGAEAPYFASCVRGEDSFVSQLRTAGALLASNVGLSTEAVNGFSATTPSEVEPNQNVTPRVLTDLPPYAWDHAIRFWYESRMSRSIRSKQFNRHPLLGSRYLEDTPSNPSWRCGLRFEELPWLQGFANVNEKLTAPQSMFVSMAIEAVHQLQTYAAPDASFLCLASVGFHEDLSLNSSQAEDAGLELHLTTSKCRSDLSRYDFTVSSLRTLQDNSSQIHCTGTFGWDSDFETCRGGDYESYGDVDHQPFLLEMARSFGQHLSGNLKNLSVSSLGANASIERNATNADNVFDPAVLHDLLQLPIIAALGQKPASIARLSKVGCIRLSNTARRIPVSKVTAGFSRWDDESARSNIRVQDTLAIQGTQLVSRKVGDIVLPCHSLFFKSETRPDISQLPKGQRLTLATLLDLVTHKWPMCDIGLAGLTDEDLDSILTCLQADYRPRFRSVQTLGPVRQDIDVRAHMVAGNASQEELHFLICGNDDEAAKYTALVRNGGIAAVKSDTSTNGMAIDEIWTVSTPAQAVRPAILPHNTVVFKSPDANVQCDNLAGQQIPLTAASLRQFSTNTLSHFDAIVIDSPTRPIVATWPGKVLLPWLQQLLKYAESIIWVGGRSELDPLNGASSAILRSLQNERPSLKVKNVVLCEEWSPGESTAAVEAALQELGTGDRDLDYVLDNGQRSLLRWYPDDALSVHTGLLPDFEGLASISIALSENATYVVIGGLGGLGRHVCKWLVDQGAKHITVISRSGPKSDAAAAANAVIKAKGASLMVIQADACNESALFHAFDEVRQQRPIKGLINMAMVLGDAPFASMTGEEWDRSLRLKVDSAWNMHQLSKDDKLDFFVLFSSIASVLGNRNQANYNCGNAFLNALAEHRRAQSLPAVAIALGAMTDIGVLHETCGEEVLSTLTKSGLTHLGKHHLDKIMQAAILECANPKSDRAVILTGLDMLERVNDKLIGNVSTTELYWTELPEFSHLQYHIRTRSGAKRKDANLLQQLRTVSREEGMQDLQSAFVEFLAGLLGLKELQVDGTLSFLTYGLDSLSGVACQYWFHRGVSSPHLTNLCQGRANRHRGGCHGFGAADIRIRQYR